MGTASFHIVGRGCAESLNSCSHGAGRIMSRSEARRNISRRQFEIDMQNIGFDKNRLHALVDESPRAYKNIDKVMRAQKDLVKQVRRLRPILNYKGK